MRRLRGWRRVLFGRLGEWCPRAGGCELPPPQSQEPKTAGESVCGYNRCSGGLTCHGGRLEGWRSQDNGVSTSSPFCGASKPKLDTQGRGSEMDELRRSPRSCHLLVVSQRVVLHVVERQSSPTKTPGSIFAQTTGSQLVCRSSYLRERGEK